MPRAGGANTGSAADASAAALDRPRLLGEALAHYQAARLGQAEPLCALLLRADPLDPDALQLLGLVRLGQGQPESALDCMDRALRRSSGASLLCNRAVVLRSLGRLDEAVTGFRAALEHDPADSMLLWNLGVTLRAAGRWEECIEALDALLAREPRNLDAINARGFALYQTGDRDALERSVREAHAIDPRHAPTLANLGMLQLARDEPLAALETTLEAIRLAPGNEVAWENLGSTYFLLSRAREAREAYERAFRISPTLANRLRRDLLLPFINESVEQIASARAGFERQLEALTGHCGTVPLPAQALYCPSAFLLAYHGENDVGLMRKLARFYLGLCPALGWQAPHVGEPAGRSVRIGFFSVNTHTHSVSRSYGGLVARLARDPRFEVVLLSPRDPAEEGTKNFYADFHGQLVLTGRQYLAAREAIAAERLDILVYQDIGMDALGYFLAFSRLARVQCVLGGHPDTTGIPNLDYFISTALAEPPEAQAHYSEKLLLISCLPAVFERPASPRAPARRADFGLPTSGAIYLCPMMLHKLHPDFDAAIAGILERDPHGHVVLFRHYSARWEEALGARLDAALPAAARARVLFLPWIRDYADFIRINALADVVIDPFHFGIGSTAAATLAVGTPLVTRPGEFLRGRVGLALCTLLELPECVTHSLAEYVARAVAIAHDAALRERLRTRILANNARLYDDRKPVRELADLFARIARRPVETTEVT
jgi:predicted O-linked N-acetylglucosamine transferase (SPINDLY family)